MNVGKVIYDVLKNDVDVAALVSTRIHPVYAPQESAYPLVTFSIPKGTRFLETKDGASTLDFVPLSVDCFSETYDECADLAEKVRVALDRYTGTVATITVDNIVIDEFENDFDEDINKYWNTLDFTIAVKR